MRNRLVGVVLGVCLSSCGDPPKAVTSLPTIPVPNGMDGFPPRIAGSSPTDVWAEYETVPVSIWHYDGTHWASVVSPSGNPVTANFNAPVITSAGAGAIWIFDPELGALPPVIWRLAADGTTENHSAEIVGTGVGTDYGYSLVAVHVSPQGATYVEMAQAPNPGVMAPIDHRLYSVVAGHFHRLVDLPLQTTATAVLSDTEIWVVHDGSSPRMAQRYVGGQWIPADPALGASTQLPNAAMSGQTFQWGAGSATDTWFVGPEGLGTSDSPGAIMHFDGTTISRQPLLTPPFTQVGEGVGLWGIISVAPGVVAILRNHTTPNNVDVESERWDGTHFGTPKVIVHNACIHSGCESLEVLAPVLARLTDGTIVQAKTRSELDANMHSFLTRDLILGQPSDY